MGICVNDCYKNGLAIIDENPVISVDEFVEKLVARSKDTTEEGTGVPVSVWYNGSRMGVSEFYRIVKADAEIFRAADSR